MGYSKPWEVYTLCKYLGVGTWVWVGSDRWPPRGLDTYLRFPMYSPQQPGLALSSPAQASTILPTANSFSSETLSHEIP